MERRYMKTTLRLCRVVLLAAALFAGFENGGAFAGPPPKLIKIRYAQLAPGVANVHVDLAVEKGIFAARGIELESHRFNSGGPEALAAVAGGDIDMGNFGSPVL